MPLVAGIFAPVALAAPVVTPETASGALPAALRVDEDAVGCAKASGARSEALPKKAKYQLVIFISSLWGAPVDQ